MHAFSKGEPYGFRDALKKAGYHKLFPLRLFLYAKYYNEPIWKTYSFRSGDTIDSWSRWDVPAGSTRTVLS